MPYCCQSGEYHDHDANRQHPSDAYQVGLDLAHDGLEAFDFRLYVVVHMDKYPYSYKLDGIHMLPIERCRLLMGDVVKCQGK